MCRFDYIATRISKEIYADIEDEIEDIDFGKDELLLVWKTIIMDILEEEFKDI